MEKASSKWSIEALKERILIVEEHVWQAIFQFQMGSYGSRDQAEDPRLQHVG